MKKILFINPSNKNSIFEKVKVLRLPPLNLALLAALTPDTYDPLIIDEAMTPINFDIRVDLVAITCMTPQAPRAYEISQIYRKRGVPVIIGGIHPSMMSEEAQQYADSVLTGEVEGIWHTVLHDADSGRLQKTYRGGQSGLHHLPLPRRDLLPKGYFTETIQTTRGCPFDCHFCSVTQFNGGKYRFRGVNEVIREINTLRGNRFFFVDDNIIGYGEESHTHALEVFERLKGLNKIWGSQICIHIAKEERLLKAAALSGAKIFFIGFESVEPDSLTSLNKKINLGRDGTNYKEVVKKLHDYGITVIGGIMLGNDGDKKDIFSKTIDFIHDVELDAVQLSLHTPFPGTTLYTRLVRENRILYKDYPNDWSRYTINDIVYQPLHMTIEELYEGYIAVHQATTSLKTSLFKAFKTYKKTKNLLGTATAFYWNYDSHKTVMKNIRHYL